MEDELKKTLKHISETIAKHLQLGVYISHVSTVHR